MQLSDLLNLKEVKEECGVEVEVNYKYNENMFRTPSSPLWKKENDPSLGNHGVEYVLVKPLDTVVAKSAVKALYKSFKDEELFEMEDRRRAGVHVHVNVQDYTCKQIFTFAYGYMLLEELLMRWCGEDRAGNHFCLRIQDAEAMLFSVVHACDNKDINNLQNENIRYSSMNFNSLFRYGSLEFRGMRTPKQAAPINQWIDMLFELKASCENFNSPLELIESMSGEGDKEFLEKILPSFSEELLSHKDYENGDIAKAARRLQMLAYVPDWDMEPQNNNPFAKEGMWC